MCDKQACTHINDYYTPLARQFVDNRLFDDTAVMENSVNTVDHAVFSGGTVTRCTANTVNTAVFAANVTRTVYTLFCAPTVNVGGGCRGVRGGGVSLKTPRYFCHGAQL
jgi:hypothetical protein